MWRFRAAVVLVVLVGTLLAGVATVYGFWWWNAEIDVEGVEVRIIWSVVDDEAGQDNYHARIKIHVPLDAEAEIKGQADTETVSIHRSKDLACQSGGIETGVDYVVTPLQGATGSQEEVSVTANGQVIGSNTGTVGERIDVNVIIPGNCS